MRSLYHAVSQFWSQFIVSQQKFFTLFQLIHSFSVLTLLHSDKQLKKLETTENEQNK